MNILLRYLPLCLLLTACTSPPSQLPPRADIPVQWQAGPQPARERLDAWWQGFADPQLAPLIERARRNNPDLGAALARVEQARAQAQVAAGNRWPTLQAGFNGNHERLLHGPGYSGIDTYRAAPGGLQPRPRRQLRSRLLGRRSGAGT